MMKTNGEILVELDYELLFSEFCAEICANKAEAFRVGFFKQWLKKNRKSIWKGMLIKGSNYGQKAAEERFGELADCILKTWESLGLLEMRNDSRRCRYILFDSDIYDIMQ